MKYLLIFLTLAILSNANAQMTIEGVKLPASRTEYCGGTKIVLNGAGVREKFFLDLYVGGLYLPKKSQDRKLVMNSDQTMAITIDIISSLITSENMTEAVDEGFEKSMHENTGSLASEIKRFKNCFLSNPITKGDSYLIIYVKGKGTSVYKNGKLLDTIKGIAFKRALWGIWFCDEPADEDLMEGMLGIDD